MYALFQISGLQYRAEKGSVLKVPLQKTEEGQQLDIADVMLVKSSKDTLVGTPYVEGAKIEAEVLRHGRDDKILVYKYKRRTKYRRRQGHRQGFTEIKVKKIVTP